MGCSASTQAAKPSSSAASSRVLCEEDQQDTDPIGLPVSRHDGSSTPPADDSYDAPRPTAVGPPAGGAGCSDEVAPFRISSSFESDAPPPPQSVAAWRSTSGEHGDAEDEVQPQPEKQQQEPYPTSREDGGTSPHAAEAGFSFDTGDAAGTSVAPLRQRRSSSPSSSSAPLCSRVDTAPYLSSRVASHSLRRRSSQEGSREMSDKGDGGDEDTVGNVDATAGASAGATATAGATASGLQRTSVSSSLEGWSFLSAPIAAMSALNDGGSTAASLPHIAVSGSSMRRRISQSSALAPPPPPPALSTWAVDTSRRASSRASASQNPRLGLPSPSSLLVHGAGTGGGSGGGGGAGSSSRVRTGNSPPSHVSSQRASLTTTAEGPGWNPHTAAAPPPQQSQSQWQHSALLMTVDDATTLGFSAFTSRSSSIASGMSAAAVIPFDFLNSHELKRDTHSEQPRIQTADPLVSVQDVMEWDRSVPRRKCSTAGSQSSKKFLPLVGDLCGPVLVLPDCGTDLAAVLLVLNAMETYCAQEHDRMLCTLFSYVVATGRSGHIALSLAQGESIQSLSQFVLEHEAFLLRSRKRDRGGGGGTGISPTHGQTSAPLSSLYHTDASTLFDTVVKLRLADQSVSGWTGSDNTRRMYHRFRRGDHFVLRPLIPVLLVPPCGEDAHEGCYDGGRLSRQQGLQQQQQRVRLVDWRSTAMVHRLFQVAANGLITIDDRSLFLDESDEDDVIDDDLFDDEDSKKPRTGRQTEGQRPAAVCAGVDEIPDPLLLALRIEPRPSVVCRIRVCPPQPQPPPLGADEAVKAWPPRDDKTALMEAEFGDDFIDIVLPAPSATISTPPPQGPPSPSAARSRASLVAAEQSDTAGVSGEWRGGGMSSASVGLEALLSPMESLLQSLSTDPGGVAPPAKRKTAAYLRQVESFVAEEEGTLMRVVDYIAIKAAKPRVLTPPDYDYGLPNSLWS